METAIEISKRIKNIKYIFIGSYAIYFCCEKPPRDSADIDLAIKKSEKDELDAILTEMGFEKANIPGEPKGTHISYLREENDKYEIVHVVIDSLKVLEKKRRYIEFEYLLTPYIDKPNIKKFEGTEIKIPSAEVLYILKSLPYLDDVKNLKHIEDMKFLINYISFKKIKEEINKLNNNIKKRIEKNKKTLLEKNLWGPYEGVL